MRVDDFSETLVTQTNVPFVGAIFAIKPDGVVQHQRVLEGCREDNVGACCSFGKEKNGMKKEEIKRKNIFLKIILKKKRKKKK